MTRRRIALIALVLLLGWSATALAAKATIWGVQPPSKQRITPQREARIRRARAQAVRPWQVNALTRLIDKIAKGTQDDFSAQAVRDRLATAPLAARLEVFIRASERRGVPVQTFQRRLRGMVRNGKRYRV